MRSIVDPSSMQSPNQARERDTRVIIDKLDLLSRDAHFIIGQMAGNVPLIVAAGRWPGPARLWPTSTQAAHRKDAAQVAARQRRPAAKKPQGVKLVNPRVAGGCAADQQ
jgi:hypothetical protein